jgi:replicative DNA helicase
VTATLRAEIDSEQALVGSLMSLPHRVEEVEQMVEPAWFRSDFCRAVFLIASDLFHRGEPFSHAAFTAELARFGQWADLSIRLEDLYKCADSRLRSNAKRIATAAEANRLALLMEQQQRALADGADPYEVGVTLAGEVDHTIIESFDRIDGLWTLPDLLVGDDRIDPWLIPGVLRAGHRVVIVAGEGAGKSVLSRQIAYTAAAGFHPFIPDRRVAPIVSLLVDLENPEDVVRRESKQMVRRLPDLGRSPSGAWLFHRPAGVNLRSPRDRRRFEKVLVQVRPQLVCLGPMYKTFEVTGRDRDDMVARELQSYLDKLRFRFGFALVIEDHAPHGESVRARQLRPMGSSLWRRWPEHGIGLAAPGDRDPTDWPKSSLVVSRWRGDRSAIEWPDRLDRGSSTLMWVGWWRDGMPEPPAEPFEEF